MGRRGGRKIAGSGRPSLPSRSGTTVSEGLRTRVGAGSQAVVLRSGPLFCPGAPVAPGRAQAVVRLAPRGRCGAMILPSGRSSPVSSKSTTPLHSRLQPCSGWCAARRADARSAESAEGHGGWCWHMGGISRSVVTCESAVVSVPWREASFMTAPRCDKSVGNQCCPTNGDPQGFRGTSPHRLMTHHPRGRFSPTALSLRVVRRGRIGLVRARGPAHRMRVPRRPAPGRRGTRPYRAQAGEPSSGVGVARCVSTGSSSVTRCGRCAAMPGGAGASGTSRSVGAGSPPAPSAVGSPCSHSVSM